MSTLHWQDEQAEIHKVVVGPMDNNVFVLRCKQTGGALQWPWVSITCPTSRARHSSRRRSCSFAASISGPWTSGR